MGILFDGTNHPSAQQVRAAGCIGCLMYGGTPQYPKDVTAAQYRDYKANGLLTPIVFEIDGNDMNGGAAGGAAHAQALLADLRNKGVANTEPVGATVDKHITAADIPLAVQYQRGFYQYVKGNGWAGPVGGYGFAEFLIAVHNAHVADWYWGAGQRSLLPPWVNIWQDNTGVINVGGRVADRDWIVVPLPPGGNVALTPDDINAIWSAPVWLHLAAKSAEAVYAVSQGYTANADGTVDIRNASAGAWLSVAALRVAMIESQEVNGLAKMDGLAALLAGGNQAEAQTDADVKAAQTDVDGRLAALASAIAALPAGKPVDVPTLVTALAGPLATALAPLTAPDMTPAQFIHLLAAELPPQ
jgi:hypothetical protein